jgi:hypothetical protein
MPTFLNWCVRDLTKVTYLKNKTGSLSAKRLYPSLALTGDISSLGNLHGKKKFYREREREMQKDRRATSGTEVLGVMHSYIIDAISSLERLAGVYEKAVHYFALCQIYSLAI